MNINKLPITDDLQEQITIGRELMASYDQAMQDYLNSIYANIKNWDDLYDITKEEMLCKATYDYWVYGFTPEQQIFYKLYGKNHEEKSQYLTFKNKFVYFARLNRRDEMQLLEDKYNAYLMLKPYYKRDIIKIETEKDYNTFLEFISNHPVFVSKPLGLSCAMGVQKIDSTLFSNKKELFDSLINVGLKYSGDYSVWGTNHYGAVLEQLIIQDKDFARIHPDSVNGVRVTTVRINGKVHIYYPWIKVGVHHDFLASAATGGFDAAIDVKTGIVETDGFLEDGNSIECHPDTKVVIKGYRIPQWEELISLATEVAMSLQPSINYVGWDFVLTPEGWIVMEGNFYGDTMWQMCYEKGMKEDFENLLGWKPEKKFWWQNNLRHIENQR